MTLKKIYTEIAFYTSWVLPTRIVRHILPTERLIKPLNKTSREWYDRERALYRLAFGMQNSGLEIPMPQYKYYKLIAQKYNWRYIKEVYDDQRAQL